MPLWTQVPVFCTICGRSYMRTPNYGWKWTMTCGPACHREFERRETLSIMGKPYTPPPLDNALRAAAHLFIRQQIEEAAQWPATPASV